jgi:hypothetical protein
MGVDEFERLHGGERAEVRAVVGLVFADHGHVDEAQGAQLREGARGLAGRGEVGDFAPC